MTTPRGSTGAFPHALSQWGRRASAAAVVVALVALTATPVFAEPAFFATHALARDVGDVDTPGVQPYSQLSCVSAGNCLVAGPLNEGSDTDATVLQQVAGTWGTATQLPLPGNADTAPSDNSQSLEGVSCWSSENCAVGGSYTVSVTEGDTSGPLPEAMVDTEADGVWATPTELTLPTSNLYTSITRVVSCDSSGDCTAAGEYIELDPTDDSITGGVFTSSELAGSGTWTSAVSLASLPSEDIGDPTSLVCPDATDCTMSLEVAPIESDSLTTYLVSEVAGTWGDLTAVANAGSRPFAILGMTCTSAGNCVAVGFTAPNAADIGAATNTVPAVQIETSGVWAAPRDLALPLLSPVTDWGFFTGISCYAAGNCLAVGDASAAPRQAVSVGIAAALSGTSWSTIGTDPVAARAGSAIATSTDLVSAQCLTATSCTVMGQGAVGGLNTLFGGPFDSNQYGFTTTVDMAGTLSVPGKPSGIKIKATTIRTKISFNPPTTDGGLRITLFTVTATSSKEHTKTCVTSGLSCSVSGLAKGHTYEVTVVAKNSKGDSKPSRPVSFKAP